MHKYVRTMGGSRKVFWGQTIYKMAIVGIKVVQFIKALHELHATNNSINDSQIPVKSTNTKSGNTHIRGGRPL